MCVYAHARACVYVCERARVSACVCVCVCVCGLYLSVFVSQSVINLKTYTLPIFTFDTQPVRPVLIHTQRAGSAYECVA